MADIIWQNADGRTAIWEMNGTSIANSALLTNPGANWELVVPGVSTPLIPTSFS
jgi:hypothetical protein